MPCTDDPCVAWSGMALVRNTEASFLFRETYPDWGDADQSNKFWVKIYNDDASATTLDWKIDGIVAD